MPKLTFDHRIQDVYGYKHPVIDKLEYANYPSFKTRVGVGINLCSIVHELHKYKYVVGDLNHENIGINAKIAAVSIVDCDSFHITNEEGVTFRTNVIMPGYLAPEIIKHCNDERGRGRQMMKKTQYVGVAEVADSTPTKEPLTRPTQQI